MADIARLNAVRLPLLATLLMLALVTPAFFYVGPIFLTPSRLLLLVALPFLLLRLLSGAYGGILLNDILMLLFIAWMSLSMLVNSPDRAIEYLGSQISIILGSYLVARATIRTKESFQAFVKLYALIILILLPLAVYESITGGFVIPKLMQSLPGINSAIDVNYERRLGLDRAQVVFTHPIHWGLYCSGAFSLVYIALKDVIPDKRRIILSAAIGGACFMSVSSGAILAMFFQIALIGYGIVMRRFDKRWKMLLIAGAVLYVALEIASSYPIVYVIVTKLALDPWTATYRANIFIFGTEQIGMTPVLGIGLNDWARPAWMKASVDNQWLLTAMQFGIPAFVLLLATFINSMTRAGGGRFRPGSELYNIRLGWNFVLFSLILTMATVALFGELTSVTFFILGAGGFLFYAKEEDPAAGATAEAAAELPPRRALIGDLAEGTEPPPPPPAAPAPGLRTRPDGRRTVL